MELKISENLKALRKQRGNTQEDLANHLGISVQAVSKWERGDGFPDITLLPYIASYYEVMVDDILGCNSLKKQSDIEFFKEKTQLLDNKGKRKESLALCREMLKKYPNEEEVLHHLMYDLFAVDCIKNSEEIIYIATKLLKSNSLEFRYGAIQILSFTYSKIGDDKKAVEYAEMVPCNKDLLRSILKGSELVEHCRWYFWNICDAMFATSHKMMQCSEAEYTAEEQHNIRETMYKLYHMIFSDGDFGFWENRLGMLLRNMAINSVEMGKIDQAFEELNEMCEHMEKYKEFTKIEHTSPLVRGLKYDSSQSGSQNEKSMAYGFLCSLNKDPRFTCLHADKRMETIKKRLKVLG
ncbi:MAG: helix-turn-helix transcriptional regulator [Clostridia bacterium]|nr:helix-turn-helix transcriptional regulator [Clostridia bacterium]